MNFKNQWNQVSDAPDLMPFDEESVATIKISDEQKRFLVEIGLPESCAPFLGFDGKVTHFIAELGIPDSIHIIGGDGGGNAICIDESRNGIIVLFDHDCDMSEQFVNSSVLHLADTLLAFRAAIRATRDAMGDDAYLSDGLSDDACARFFEVLAEKDPPAVEPGSFWHSAASE